MHLIDKEDDLTTSLADLIHHCLEALLELAAELRAGHQRSHIEGDNPLTFKRIGHIIGHNLLGEALHDGSLPYTGLPDDHRVILGASSEDLHNPFYLILTPDHRVQFTLAGEHGEVATVLLQSAVFTLCPGVGNPLSSADVLKG